MANYDPFEGRSHEKFEEKFKINLPPVAKEVESLFELNIPPITLHTETHLQIDKPILNNVRSIVFIFTSL